MVNVKNISVLKMDTNRNKVLSNCFSKQSVHTTFFTFQNVYQTQIKEWVCIHYELCRHLEG